MNQGSRISRCIADARSVTTQPAWLIGGIAALVVCVIFALGLTGPAFAASTLQKAAVSSKQRKTAAKPRCTVIRHGVKKRLLTAACIHKQTPANQQSHGVSAPLAPSKQAVLMSAAAPAPSVFTAPLGLITPAVPTISSISPTSGPITGGTSVTIKGAGFAEGATVWIGSKASSVEVVSSTEIKAKTPEGRGKDEVVVDDEGGVSASGPTFAYVSPPVVSSITPTEGTTAGGTLVHIKGRGFLKGSKVKIGSEATSVSVVSETEITAKTAAGSAAEDEVVVEDEYGSSSEGPKFTYVTPASVSAVEPSSGTTGGGTEVVITGTGFEEGAKVKIGSEATSVEVVSETEIKAKTAATPAGKDEVVVSYSNGVASTGGPSFTYVAPASVSSVAPATGTTAGGTAIVIKGKGFQKTGTKVKVGSEATGVEVLSETEIKAKTAAGSAGSDEVVVEDTFGASKGGPSFTYVAPAEVESIEPTSGSTAGGTTVTIKGKAFAKTATVTIGKAATNVEYVSETELKAKTVADTAGEDEVVVSNATNVPSTEGPAFTYVAPPTVTSVSPSTGSTEGGTAVVIKGTGFVEEAKVKIGSEATNVEVLSSTEIKAKTAATAAGKDEVVVEDTKGKNATGPTFTYVAPPSVSSIAPTEGNTAGGTLVHVKGKGFLKGSKVKIGSEAASVAIVSETEITAKTAAGSAGEDEVVVEDEYGKSAEGPKYKYVTPPTVTAIEPSSGTTAGGTEVVITGTGFEEGAKVKIGSEASSVEVVSETEIKAKTAATAAGKAEVVVSYSNGVASTGGPSFTYVAPASVTSVAPATGSTAGGTAIVIKGKGFQKTGTKVKVGSEATGVEVISETEAKAKTAAGSAGADEVVVEDTYGASKAGPSFTYVAPAEVESIEPTSGSTAGGTTVTIKGKAFAKTATVTIGKAATNVEYVSETELKAKTVADTAGEDEVVVSNATNVASAEGPKFTYIAPPTVTSITPATGSTEGGTKVVIKGTGFTEEAKVKIGSEATNVEVVSETEIKAKTAATAAGKDTVLVEDTKGKNATGPTFTYVAPPSVSSISPTEGSTAGGTLVHVKGKGFLKGSKVKIGSEATSVAIVSETEITAKAAAGSAGEDEVVVEDEYGKSAEGPKYKYVTPPTVSAIEPSSGTTAGGTEVVITGTGFEEGAKVDMGSAATNVEVVSETEIKAKTAATAAGKAEVVVAYANGVASTGGPSFTYVAPPSVTSVAPATGSTAGGTAIVIKGKGFQKTGTKVKVGSEATGVEVVSETEIKAKTAAGSAGADEVVVEDTYGASKAGPSFTYVAPAEVESIEPTSGSTAGGTTVTIKGKAFAKTATVTIGKAATNVTWVSETEMTAKTAADTAGEDEVVVSNAANVASAEGPKFAYIAPPTVTSITPLTGSTEGGTKVVIKGTGFTEGAKVKIGSEATNVEVVGETEIKAKTAATAAGKDTVVVEDTKGKNATGPTFTYVAPPSVSSITPTAGSTAGGTLVHVKGKGFLKGSKVKIGSEATSVSVVSETEITAKTAAGSAAEDEVVVEDEYGKSSEGPKFTYVVPASVSSIEPASGTTAGGTEVVITGTGFEEGAKVKIGSEATSVEVVSETEIKAKTAATAAGKAEVVVAYANGVASTGGPSFTYVAPPSVTSVAPSTGSTAGGTAIVIKGKGFQKTGTKVKVGSEATGVEVVSETEIKAKTAAGSAGADEVVVEDTYGASKAGPSFTYVAPAEVESIEPTSGSTAGGTTVTIKGKAFAKTATVTIGKAATNVTWVSETEMTAKTAADTAGEDEVVVSNATNVASAEGPKFAYIAPPTVTSITPAIGSTEGGTAVVIKGSGFVEGATVKIGSEATSVEVLSSTEIKAKTAATAAGKDTVVVEDTKGKTTTGPTFTYVAPPTVTSITPSEGSTAGGTLVHIKGKGFLKGSSVTIGKAAREVTIVSETEITAKTPSYSAGEVEVIVESEDGSSSEGPKFKFV